MSKAEKIASGLTYLLTFGRVSTAAEHDLFYAGLPEVAITLDMVTHMASLGWLVSDDEGFEIFT